MFERYGVRGIGAGAERAVATPVGEVDDIAVAARFDGGVVFLVGVENQANPVPGASAARPPPIQLDRPTPRA